MFPPTVASVDCSPATNHVSCSLKGYNSHFSSTGKKPTPLLLLCLSLSLMHCSPPTQEKKRETITRSGLCSAGSLPRKCCKALTEVEADESGGRPGTEAASGEPKSWCNLAWHEARANATGEAQSSVKDLWSREIWLCDVVAC